MNSIAVILPMLCFAALLRRDSFRESVLKAAVVCALFVIFATEILSQVKLIAYGPLTICWSSYFAALFGWRFYHKWHGEKPVIPETTGLQKVLLTLLFCIAAISGITAVVAAPNNFDSLTYHLPRVMHWIQNRSVAHYPTNIDRQLVLAPLSEYLILHLQILSGSDRFANCVQWFAMVGSAVGVSLIAQRLKGSVNCQIVSAVIAVSVPMGLLQATSTQNDYTLTFWLVCLVYFILKSKEEPGLHQALLVGVSLGLAIFTKGTAYMVAAPFMLVYLWLLRPQGMKPVAASIAVVGAAILAINAGHLARNSAVYGNPLSPGTGNDIICKRIDATSIVSCVTRNLATQLATGMTGANRELSSLTQAVHRAIGVDVNDGDLTATDNFLILPPQVQNHEDYAPNPLHMVLLLISAAALAFRWKKTSKEVVFLAVAAMSSFVILSMVLKWTPYLSRYFLPVFVISAPIIALLFDGERPRVAVDVCAVILLALSFLTLGHNKMRPLFGPQSVLTTSRTDQYFMSNPRAENYFLSLTAMAKSQPIPNIGILNNSGNMPEYLLWVLLKDNGANYRIEHVDVRNASGNIRLSGFSSYFPANI